MHARIFSLALTMYCLTLLIGSEDANVIADGRLWSNQLTFKIKHSYEWKLQMNFSFEYIGINIMCIKTNRIGSKGLWERSEQRSQREKGERERWISNYPHQWRFFIFNSVSITNWSFELKCKININSKRKGRMRLYCIICILAYSMQQCNSLLLVVFISFFNFRFGRIHVRVEWLMETLEFIIRYLFDYVKRISFISKREQRKKKELNFDAFCLHKLKEKKIKFRNESRPKHLNISRDDLSFPWKSHQIQSNEMIKIPAAKSALALFLLSHR